jgi:hypothetical protein
MTRETLEEIRFVQIEMRNPEELHYTRARGEAIRRRSEIHALLAGAGLGAARESENHVDHATKLPTLPEALEYVWQDYHSPNR